MTETEFYKGCLENLNPNDSLNDQANLLPFEKDNWELSRDTVKLGNIKNNFQSKFVYICLIQI